MTRLIDAIADYIAALDSTQFVRWSDTALDGNVRTDGFNPNLTSTQVIIQENTSGQPTGIRGIRRESITISVYGTLDNANNTAFYLLNHFSLPEHQAFTQGDYRCLSIRPEQGDITPRGQIFGEIFGYWFTLLIAYA